jgi:hypothetical protein
MHELASMAATKAQEMALPPPPPADFVGSPAAEKPPPVEGEKDGSTSESSLESSSGYGSQTTFTAEDAAHAEGECRPTTKQHGRFLFLHDTSRTTNPFHKHACVTISVCFVRC